MEVYVCSIRRHVLFVTLVLLAVLGNEPHRTVHAQVGTTLGLAAAAGGRTTVLPVRTTQQASLYRTTQAGGGQPYATTNAAPGGGVTQRATGGVNTQAATAPGPQTTLRAGAATTQAPGGASTARPGGGGAVASTQRVVTQRPAGTTRAPAAGTTRGAIVSTASPSKINEFNIEYIFKIQSPLQGNENSCVSESTKDLANTFGISTSRVTAVTCTQTDTDTIKVTARITPGSKPTLQDLENFKARSDYTTVRFNGWQNRIGEINRGSFKYEKVTTPSSSSSEQIRLLGLSETHWIMIGMGAVILLLFIVSITIICVGRRGGDASRERMDEEASAAASEADSEEDEQPKKKWYSFLQRRKKGDDDSDGNRTDDESAYESAKGDDGSESDQESEKIHDDHKVV